MTRADRLEKFVLYMDQCISRFTDNKPEVVISMSLGLVMAAMEETHYRIHRNRPPKTQALMEHEHELGRLMYNYLMDTDNRE